MSTTNWSSHRPSLTSRAAWTIASPVRRSSSPSDMFTSAAAVLMIPSALINGRVNRKPLMGKFCTARAVEAP
jgi:hypothetical protein